MPVAVVSSSSRANLSAQYLQENTDFSPLLQSDYISIGKDNEQLFDNDEALAVGVNQNEINIATNAANIATNAANIATNTANISLNTLAIATNAADIATNTADIATNSADIATNTAAITDINDGRYSPQFGAGSPEGVVTSNRNQTYFDLSVPEMWVNPAIGVNTGWVQIV